MTLAYENKVSKTSYLLDNKITKCEELATCYTSRKQESKNLLPLQLQ